MKYKNQFGNLAIWLTAVLTLVGLSAHGETLSVVYDPIEGGIPPRVDISFPSSLNATIIDVSHEEWDEQILILHQNGLKLSIPLNYPAWFLIDGERVISQCEFGIYTLEETGNAEMSYDISVKNEALTISGFGEGARVDLYDEDDNLHYS